MIIVYSSLNSSNSGCHVKETYGDFKGNFCGQNLQINPFRKLNNNKWMLTVQ